MGRRIVKSKRHKKIKAVDPFYKGERKRLLDKDAERSNNKPSNPDAQEIPRKLREIAESVKLLKEGKLNQKRTNKKINKDIYNEGDDYGPTVKGCERPAQSLPVFTKAPKETDRHFLRRIDVASRRAIAQSKLEKKFDITIVEDQQGDSFKDKQTLVLGGKTTVISKKPSSKAKKLKRKRFEEKQKAKKKVKLEKNANDFQHLKDKVGFGEVAVQPPSIAFLPRKAADVSAIKKSGAKALLLKNLLHSKENTDSIRDSHLNAKSVCSIDLTVKRKHLSIADRYKLDTEREKAIRAYRTSKKKQWAQKEANHKARRRQ